MSEPQDCLWCGGELGDVIFAGVRDRLGVAPGEWAFVGCRVCESLNLSPRPPETRVAEFYAETYTLGATGGHDSSQTLTARLRRVPLKAAQFLLYRPIVKRHVRWVSRQLAGTGRHRARLLDIGCGSGRHLRLFRRSGYDVVGADIDQRACEELARVGIPTVHGSVDNALEQYGPESFDVITAFHVLEHLPNVRAFLLRCAQLLRPQGVLAGAVPAGNGTLCRLLGRSYEPVTEAPRHVTLPSDAGIMSAFASTGFRDIRLVRGSIVNVAGCVALSIVPASTTSCGAPPLQTALLGGAIAMAALPLAAITEVFMRPSEVLFAATRGGSVANSGNPNKDRRKAA